MPYIKNIKARTVLDSRGFPTVEAEVISSNGIKASAIVPSGASTGKHEAVELRDGGKDYFGKDVKKAVKNVSLIAKKLKNKNINNLQQIDSEMIRLDGTENKGRLGANAILAVSMATARLGALNAKMPLYQYLRKTYKLKHKNYLIPTPMLNIINGGKHADSGIDVQEFMIVPINAVSFSKAFSTPLKSWLRPISSSARAAWAVVLA